MDNYKKKCTSKYFGVSYKKDKRKFECRVNVNNKAYRLGYFSDEYDAAIAYDKFVTENNLEKRLNFIDVVKKDEYTPVGATKIYIHHNKYAIVDDNCVNFILSHKWYFVPNKGTPYACSTIIVGNKTKQLRMHREVFEYVHGYCPKFIDHINGNGLDNRADNLRECTQAQNNRNSSSRRKSSSKYKGVSIAKNGKIHAQINKGGKQIHIGSFKTEVEAALAYNKKATELFSEFARLNDIP